MTIKVLLISISLILPLYAGTIDPHISDQKYIAYADEFESIGKICGSYNDGTLFCASAVAIDNHHVLTAAHVVKNSKECKFVINDKEFCLTNVVYHKDFESKFGIGDIAIGYSEKSIDLESYPELYLESDEVGQSCSISGYGLTGTFRTGTKISDNKKRAGTNTIDSTYEDLLVCSASIFGTKDHTHLEFLIGSGDSGGGLFIDGKLAGINSCVMADGRSPNSVYGDQSGHTRISNYIEWIKNNRRRIK
jgi:TATA-box binding protein (TBP) (component of TFIID and TFIIIB)